MVGKQWLVGFTVLSGLGVITPVSAQHYYISAETGEYNAELKSFLGRTLETNVDVISLRGGHRFNPHFAVEARYSYLKFDKEVSYQSKGSNKGYSLGVGVNTSIPLSSLFNVNINTGLQSWSGKTRSGSKAKVSGYYGVGLDVGLTPELSLSLEYHKDQWGDFDAKAYTLGARYDFPSRFSGEQSDFLSRFYVQALGVGLQRGELEKNVLSDVTLSDFSGAFFEAQFNPSDNVERYGRLIGKPLTMAQDDADYTLGSTVYLGYVINDWFGVELGYSNYGSLEYSVGTVKALDGSQVAIDQALMKSEAKGYTLGINSVLWRAPEGFGLYGRLGVQQWESKLTLNTLVDNAPIKRRLSALSPYAGMGIAWNVWGPLTVLGEYSVYFRNLTFADTQGTYLDHMLSIGVQWALGSRSQRLLQTDRRESMSESYLRSLYSNPK